MAEFLKSLELFQDSSGKVPFESWIKNVRDKKSKARILQRIDRLRLGNYGDCKSVGSGVYELRIHFGPGFRVYFGLEGESVILLLCGGDKSTEKKDIENAHKYWMEYKENENKEL
jgi:putative addiction module killer protein